MNHRGARVPREVRFNVTLSPTWMVSGGPGRVTVVFVKPQPAALLPYSVIPTSLAAAAGVENADTPRRAAAMPNATTKAVCDFDITSIPFLQRPMERPPKYKHRLFFDFLRPESNIGPQLRLLGRLPLTRRQGFR